MLHVLDWKLSPSFWLLVRLSKLTRFVENTWKHRKKIFSPSLFNHCCFLPVTSHPRHVSLSSPLCPPPTYLVPFFLVLSSALSVFFFSSCAVEAFEEVSDSLCVPQYNADGEERVILFLKMAPGKPFSADLVGKIKGAIRKALSARHVPALLLETKDIPVRGTININQIVCE